MFRLLQKLRPRKAHQSPHQRVPADLRVVSLGNAYLDLVSAQAEAGVDKNENSRLLIQAAEAAERPNGYSEEYDLLKPYFDVAFYFARYPAIARARLDPIAHYIRAGNKEDYDPAPWFSTRSYKERYPTAAKSGMTALGDWLETGRAQGHVAPTSHHHDRLSEVLGLTPENSWEIIRSRNSDIRMRLTDGKLGEMVGKAATLDPLIERSRTTAMYPKITPFTGDRVLGQVVALNDLFRLAEFRPAKVVILTDGMRDFAEGHGAAGLADIFATQYGAEAVLVLMTGCSRPPVTTRYPDGVRLICAGDILAGSDPLLMQRVVAEFLRSLAPESCYIMEHTFARDLIENYGRQLKDAMKTIVCTASAPLMPDDLSGPQILPGFYRHADRVTLLTTADSAQYDDLAHRFTQSVANGSLTTLTPLTGPPVVSMTRADPPLVVALTSNASGAEVDLFLAIARSLPDLPFRLLVAGGEFRRRRYSFYPERAEVLDATDEAAAQTLSSARVWLDLRPDRWLSAAARFAATAGIPVVCAQSLPSILGSAPGLIYKTEGADVAAWVQAINTCINSPLPDPVQALALQGACHDALSESLAVLYKHLNEGPMG